MSSESEITTDTEPLLQKEDYIFMRNQLSFPDFSQEYGIIPDIADGVKGRESQVSSSSKSPKLDEYKGSLNGFGTNKRGKYGLQLVFAEETTAAPKACAWTYSAKLNKLFCRKSGVIPFLFQTQQELPLDKIKLKCYLSFKNKKDEDEIVCRCPYHLDDDKSTEELKKQSVIQDCNTTSVYLQCDVTQRYFIDGVQLKRTAPCKYQATMTMTCVSSCHGGINRRETVLVFLLYLGNNCDAECRIDIKSSASPGRCRTMAEDKFQADQLKEEKKNVCSKENTNTTSTSSTISKNTSQNTKAKNNLKKRVLPPKTIIITNEKKPRRNSVIVPSPREHHSFSCLTDNASDTLSISPSVPRTVLLEQRNTYIEDINALHAERNIMIGQIYQLKELSQQLLQENSRLKEENQRLKQKNLAGKTTDVSVQTENSHKNILQQQHQTFWSPSRM